MNEFDNCNSARQVAFEAERIEKEKREREQRELELIKVQNKPILSDLDTIKATIHEQKTYTEEQIRLLKSEAEASRKEAKKSWIISIISVTIGLASLIAAIISILIAKNIL